MHPCGNFPVTLWLPAKGFRMPQNTELPGGYLVPLMGKVNILRKKNVC